ncbi:Uma2 family endonuclease [Chamaesiphon sp. OTE_75_metabat_556]|uniref:Uma2 family endonuclease n=1 Tax=Chamaesiphon sp. OTE_75_metabat_556 TaxID=2964692 RepID=UPI00286C5E9A|nr:Uma2 family endonuclease [Chamaesiphon sp. OTE_75_metabat_556]
MIAAREHFPKLTPAEYLEWEEQQELRYEYIDGEIYAMTGGTLNHSEIGGNFYYLLKTHLGGSGCRVLNSDAKVQIAESNDYVYPDISVTCDERDRSATKFISHPCTIVEVLSPSTKAYDRWEKFNLYRRSDILQDYVLVDTDQVEIALYSKNDRGKWEITRYVAGDIVELKSINLTFSIEQVFEGIVFAPELES